MRRNLSQVGNPGRASMSDGRKPTSLGAHYFFVFAEESQSDSLTRVLWLLLKV